MSERTVISTPESPAAIGPYSQGIVQGGFLFTSGQLPLDPATGALCSESAGEQARRCMKNAAAIAKAAGTDLSKAVKSTIFLVDMKDFAEVNAVYAEFFPGTPPARSCVAVVGMAKNARVEIEFIIAL